jgi:D-alanine-D-alanine ligase-like ATP-grasp enzyme
MFRRNIIIPFSGSKRKHSVQLTSNKQRVQPTRSNKQRVQPKRSNKQRVQPTRSNKQRVQAAPEKSASDTGAGKAAQTEAAGTKGRVTSFHWFSFRGLL